MALVKLRRFVFASVIFAAVIFAPILLWASFPPSDSWSCVWGGGEGGRGRGGGAGGHSKSVNWVMLSIKGGIRLIKRTSELRVK